MAVVDVVVPPPSSPWLALVSQQACSWLALVTADAVVCLGFVSYCTLFAAFATMVVGNSVHGDVWPVANTAMVVGKSVHNAHLLLHLLLHMAKLTLRILLGDTVIAAAIRFVAFALIGIAGALLVGFPENKESPRGRIGSVRWLMWGHTGRGIRVLDHRSSHFGTEDAEDEARCSSTV